MLKYIAGKIAEELKNYVLNSEDIKQEFNRIMGALQDLRTATAAVAGQLTQLESDVTAYQAAQAAALSAAEANTVTEADVQAVQALGTQAAAIDAQVNPPAPAPTPSGGGS